MKKTLLLNLLLILSSFLFAQSDEPCGQVDYLHTLEKQYPGFIKNQDKYYQALVQQANTAKLNKIGPGDTVYRIPVVFHVVYNTTLENLHDSLIYSQLDVLNACFRRRNADTIKTRDIFKPVAADAGIEFYLADVDPNGNATNGITRTFTSRTTFYDVGYSDDMKFTARGGQDVWNPTKYLNIWVCDLNFNGFDMLMGYAFPPTDAQFWGSQNFVSIERQGVVLHYKIVGKNNPSFLGSSSTAEKTAVHEVGHFLGLRHVWGDGNSSTGCNVDDGLFDTPNTRIRHNGCTIGINTCSAGVAGDLPDQAENYMDYSSYTCTNMFSAQQVNLMRYNLKNLRSTINEYYVLPVERKITANALFPNPTNGSLTLEIANYNVEDIYKISVKDMLGREVWVLKKKLSNINQFELLGVPSGVYNLELFSAKGKEVLSHKIIVVRN